MTTVAVSPTGGGRLREIVAERIARRSDLRLTDDAPDVLVALDDALVIETLRAGIDVVCSAPLGAFSRGGLLDACRAGSSTFHATGGFRSVLPTRVVRAFSRISRDIQRVVLTDSGDPEVLGEFGGVPDAERALVEALAEQSVDAVEYRTETGSAPLQFRLSTVTPDAVGHATITFQGSDIHPADHLAAAALLDAIVPTYRAAPGILHADPDIDHLRPDGRLG